MMDTDGDHKISKAESAAFHAHRFTDMDADNDGYVTSEEAKAHHKKMRQKRHEKRSKAEKS